MSQEVTLSRRATLIRKLGILYPENPNDIIAFSALQPAAQFSGTTKLSAAQTEIYLDGVSKQFTLTKNAVYGFLISVMALKSDGSKVYHANIEGTIQMGATAATTAFVGNPNITVISDNSSGWSSTVSADTTNGALSLKVTADAASTVKWVASINAVKVV
jgi:hypothetical protein